MHGNKNVLEYYCINNAYLQRNTRRSNMSSTTITFRTDSAVKEQASQIYESLGMNLSTALNMFMKQTILKQAFPCCLDSEIASDSKSTYPDGFFELLGTGDNLGFDEEPEDFLPSPVAPLL